MTSPHVIAAEDAFEASQILSDLAGNEHSISLAAYWTITELFRRKKARSLRAYFMPDGSLEFLQVSTVRLSAKDSKILEEVGFWMEHQRGDLAWWSLSSNE